ncbi:MAG: ribonuclease P protein component 4 [Candidatus Woesearchaeota archaeon]
MKNKFKTKKIAKEHISSLFKQAKDEFPDPISKRYIYLARKYGTKHNISLPKTMRDSICKNCNTLLVPSKTCTVRIKPGKNKLIIKTCTNCGTIKRLGLKK